MNKEEIDKWLDNEYGVSYTSLEEIHDWLVDENMKKDKEIERLCNALNEVIERNSKAIEYVESNVIQIKLNEVGTVTTVSERFDKDEFLDILQGVDK